MKMPKRPFRIELIPATEMPESREVRGREDYNILFREAQEAPDHQAVRAEFSTPKEAQAARGAIQKRADNAGVRGKLKTRVQLSALFVKLD